MQLTAAKRADATHTLTCASQARHIRAYACACACLLRVLATAPCDRHDARHVRAPTHWPPGRQDGGEPGELPAGARHAREGAPRHQARPIRPSPNRHTDPAPQPSFPPPPAAAGGGAGTDAACVTVPLLLFLAQDSPLPRAGPAQDNEKIRTRLIRKRFGSASSRSMRYV